MRAGSEHEAAAGSSGDLRFGSASVVLVQGVAARQAIAAPHVTRLDGAARFPTLGRLAPCAP